MVCKVEVEPVLVGGRAGTTVQISLCSGLPFPPPDHSNVSKNRAVLLVSGVSESSCFDSFSPENR